MPTGYLWYHAQRGCYEGQTADGALHVRVPEAAMVAARHQTLRRGGTLQGLRTVELWLWRNDLRQLPGVAIRDR